MLTNSALCRAIRNKTPQEQLEFLLSQGLTQEQAQDFIADAEQRKPKLTPGGDDTPFSKGPAFQRIQESIKRLMEERKRVL